jgi:CBS domain-containing protein
MNIMRFLIPKSLVEYVTADSSVRQAVEKMRYHRYVAIPVIDSEGKYVGTLRNDDVLSYFLENGSFDTRSAERHGVENLLDSNYSPPVYHDAAMDELIEKIREHNFVPVVDDRGCFVGIILRRDILNFLFDYYKKTISY